MKKFFAALLSVMMVLSLVSIPVQAEGEVVFTCATVTDVTPGDTVSVPVTLEGSNFTAHTLNMYVEYDTELLTLNSATEGSAISGATMKLLDTTSEPGKVKLGLLYATTGLTAGGELFTMNFTVSENATENIPLTVVVTEFNEVPVGGNETPVPFTTVDGAIELNVPEPPPEHTLDEALNVEGGELHFENDATYPWEIIEEDGRLYAKSTNIGIASSVSKITFTYTATDGEALSFDFISMGEGSDTNDWDGLRLYVDGALAQKWGANHSEWETFTYDLTAGEHTIELRYKKDSSVNGTGDYACVDNVEIVEGLVPPTEEPSSEPPTTEPPTTEPQTEEPFDGIIWDFETDPWDQGFETIDSDGDSYNWYWVENASPYEYHYEGNGCMKSDSYMSGVGALTPDNWLVTPEFTGGTSISFWLNPRSSSFNEEYVGVYVSVVGDEGWSEELWGMMLPEDVTPVEYTVDLSAYAGQQIQVAFRHYDCEDQYSAMLDYITIPNPGETPPPEPQIIDTIEINDFVEPAWGENPAYDCTVPSDAHYSIDYMDWNWWDDVAEDGDVMAPSEAFDNEGYVYYAYWEIIPEEGYAFADEVTVLINGDATIVETKGLSESFGYYWAYTIDFTVEDPGTEPPAGDLDEALNVEGGELHFETGETYPWIVVEDEDRMYAKSSNEGVASSTSVLTTIVNVEAGDCIVFEFMAWGEGTGGEVGVSVWDKCEFYVNGELVMKVGALQNDWQAYGYQFEEAGEYELLWQYAKDSSVNPTGDFFAVDNVEITDELPPEPIVIDTIEINDFVVPAWNEAPFYGVTVPEDAHYSVEDTVWSTWDGENSVTMVDGDLFNDPTLAYYMGILLVAEDGYKFDESPYNDEPTVTELVATINGSGEYVTYISRLNDTTVAVYTIDFYVQPEEEVAEFYVNPDYQTAAPGEEITASVLVSGEFEAHILNLELNYDSAVFEVTNATMSSVLEQATANGGVVIVDYTTVPGSIRVGVIMPNEPFDTDGELINIDLTVKDDAAEGSYFLVPVVTEFRNFPIDGEPTDIPFDVVHGEVEIEGEPQPPEPGTVTFTVDSPDQVEQGEEFDVVVSVAGEYEAHGMNYKLAYDSSVFEIVSVDTDSDVLYQVSNLNGAYIVDYETEEGVIHLGYIMPDEGVTAEGTLITVTFKAKEDAAPGLYDFTQTVDELRYYPLDAEEGVDIPYELVDDTTEIVGTSELGSATFTVTTGRFVQVERGEEFNAQLTISGDYIAAHGLNMMVNYDADNFELVNIESGEILADCIVVVDYETIPGSIRLGAMQAEEGFSGEGILLNMTFKAKEDAAVGIYDFVPEVTEFRYFPVEAEEGMDIPYETVEDQVEIVDTVTVPPTEVPPTEVPPTEVPPTEVPPTEVPPTEVPPTEVPPTEVPPTEVPPTEEPPVTEPPTTPPTPPTGTIALVGLGIAAIVAGAGVILFRKKED